VGTNTYNSQTTFVLPVAGSQGTTFIYMGDRWNPGDLGDSPYIWQPLQVSGTSISLAWHNSWSPNISAGTWADMGNAYYTMTNANSGLLLDDANNSTTPGNAMVQWSSNGGSNQQWELTAAGTTSFYYTITNNKSGLVLDDANNSTAPGNVIDQWNSNGGANQQWKFSPV
jgi:Ricin-type beta-trefoil lectin domain-like